MWTMELQFLRDQLDEIDHTLEEKFAERMQIAEKIGAYKRDHDLPTFDAEREAEVIAKHTEGQPEELRPYMEEFFRSVMALSRQLQDDQKSEDL